MKLSTSMAALAVAMAFSAPAGAADIFDARNDALADPVQAQVNWSGLQANIMGGYAFGNSEVPTDFFFEDEKIGSISLDGLGSDGWAGEVGIGYDHQISGRWVVGAEVKYQLSNALSELTASGDEGSFVAELEQDNTVLAGVRLGHVAPSHMWYIGGGYARREYEDATAHIDGELDGSLDLPTFEGWYAEAGVEKHLGGSAFFRFTGRYLDFNEETVASGTENGVDYRVGYDPDELQILGGVVFKFGGF